MYKIIYTNRMKKDVKRVKRRGKDISKLVSVFRDRYTRRYIW